jgi:hypothetical protein
MNQSLKQSEGLHFAPDQRARYPSAEPCPNLVFRRHPIEISRSASKHSYFQTSEIDAQMEPYPASVLLTLLQTL